MYAPDIPTMRESGVEGYEEAGSELWFGVFARAGTPAPVVERLQAELVKALRRGEVSERICAPLIRSDAQSEELTEMRHSATF